MYLYVDVCEYVCTSPTQNYYVLHREKNKKVVTMPYMKTLELRKLSGKVSRTSDDFAWKLQPWRKHVNF